MITDINGQRCYSDNFHNPVWWDKWAKANFKKHSRALNKKLNS